MLTLKIQDKNISQREKDDNGFLIVKNNPIAKAGVFEYLLSELKADINENEDRIVKVYRPFDELIKVKDTFANKPIKMNHIWVGEDDYKADGAISSDISVDDENLMLRADLIIYNPDLIKAIENGEMVELSPAYTGEEQEQGGRFNGEDYEFIQKIICVNHLAVVETGRSGKDLRIQDKLNQKMEDFRQMKRKFKDSFYKHLKKYFDEDEVAKQDEETKEDEDIIEQKQDDKREIIREIMAISAKDISEFEGGEEEKERLITELAEKLAYTEDEEAKQDEEAKEEKQDEETTESEVVIEGEKIPVDEIAEVVAEATEAIVEKKITEYQDKQRKELKKVNDTYVKVSEALGTSFDYRGMNVNDLYKFGYEALTNQRLDKKMDAMTAFLMVSNQKATKKYNDNAFQAKSNISEILKNKY